MFYKTAEILNEVLLTASKSSNEQLMATYLIPHIVNKSFATEMAIKAILTKEAISYRRTHRLDKLFKLLPMDLQNAIIITLKKQYVNLNINDEIILIGEAFVQWRYFHDTSNSIKHGFFNVFTEIICKLCYENCNIQYI